MPNYYEDVNQGALNTFGGGKIPKDGVYEAEITEGVKLHTGEKTGKVSILIPFRLISIAAGRNGDPDSLGLVANLYTGPNNEFGKKTLAQLIVHTNQLLYFKDKYGNEIPDLDSPNFRPFMTDLIQSFPGKPMVISLVQQKGNTGGILVNFNGFGPSNRQGSAPQATSAQEQPKPAPKW